MPSDRLNKIQEYTQKKAKGLERIRQSAQSSFVRAQSEKAKGSIEQAVRWMDRAHRLAGHNPNITFDLVMLKLKQQQYDEAYKLLAPLMKKFDFYEGWLVLAILLTHKNKLSQSVEHISYALSNFSPTKKTWEMIKDIIGRSDNNGCCGLVGSLGQVWIENKTGEKISVFLDDKLIAQTSASLLTLPPDWESCSYLHLNTVEGSLVGSPINIQAIIRMEGFVENDNAAVKGWAWYPAEPERMPTIYVYNQQGDLQQVIEAVQEFDVAVLEFPLFRARQFEISLDEFSSELYGFHDQYGRHLIGSPINPLLLRNKTKQSKVINQNYEYIEPVSAYYKGDHPNITLDVSNEIVIIIPVYKGKEETIACIQSVIGNISSGFVIQLVNDFSPDTELIDWLEKKVNCDNIFLIHHLENMGFPGAVNTGMMAWPGHDVILLNSDSLVAKGWAETLQKAAYSDKDIGTVTPFSNDASILSYPYHDKENPVPTLGSVKSLMRYMHKTHQSKIVDIPTAHGFCMYIRHDCLAQTGLFRENIFAQGYGEENDFCMRAQHLGWRHVLAAGCFVGHKGGVSFQNGKQALLKRNIKILNQLYPHYDEMILDYIDRDFLRLLRRQADLYRLQDQEKKQKKMGEPFRYGLFITHTYGGGVERAVQECANELRLKGIVPLLIRPTFIGDACQLELQFRSSSSLNVHIEEIYPNLVFQLPQEYCDLLYFLKNRIIVSIQVHHFAGHHKIIRQLLQDLPVDYDIYLHDYMSFCPRISLINKDEVYCGEPSELSVCQQCVGLDHFDEENPINMQNWIDRSYRELKQARKVIAPSEDTASRIHRHFPELDTIEVRNLEDDRSDLSLKQLSHFSKAFYHRLNIQSAKDTRYYRVCIIGAIGIEKGFNVIKALVKDADQRDLPIEYVLVGRTVDDRLFMNTNRLFITGSYKEEEAVHLVMEQSADIALFPAIWPETWCYALSIAWRSGLRTVAYDMGAIAQRIKNTQRGWILSPLMAIPEQNDMLLNLCKRLRYKNNL